VTRPGIAIEVATAAWLGLAGLAWFVAPHPAVGPALALAPVLAGFALRQPFLLSAGFAVFSFFRLHEVVPQLMPFKLPLLLALGTMAAVGWSIAFGRIRPFWHRLMTPFAIFFALVTLGLVLGTNTGNAFAYWKDTYVKIAMMVFAIAWAVHRPVDLRTISRVMVAAVALVALVALSNKASGIGLVEGSRVTIGRDIGSVLGDPNDLSLVLLFGGGFALTAALGRGLGGVERLLGLLVFCLVAAAIVATQSRGGLLGLAAVTGIGLAERVRSKMLLGGAGILALALLFAVAGIDDRQSGGAHEEGIDESAMGRLHAWGAAFRMALAHPLSGVGIDNFYFNYYLHSDFWDGQNHAVHSTWFGVLGETGFLGLAVFLWLVIALLRLLLRARRLPLAALGPEGLMLATSARGLFAGLVGFLVSGTFLTQGFTWPLYIILALAIPLDRMARDHAGPSSTSRPGDLPCRAA